MVLLWRQSYKMFRISMPSLSKDEGASADDLVEIFDLWNIASHVMSKLIISLDTGFGFLESVLWAFIE